MTEGYQPYPSTDAETEFLPPVSADTGTTAMISSGQGGLDGGGLDGGGQKTTEVAKEQAGDLTQGTVHAGQHVASVAKDQAASVTAEAGRQAKDLLGQARSELSQQVSSQQQRVADGLKSLSQQLHSMSEHSDQPGLAADLARQGAQATEQVASWFDGRDPGAVLDEVRSFGRRRPGTFLLLAAGAGLLAGRLTRGLKDEASGGTEQGGADGYRRSDLTSGTAGAFPAGSFTHPETAELTTGLPGAGGLSGTGGLPGAGGLSGAGGLPGQGSAGGFAPGAAPAGPLADEPLPYVSQDGEFGYPATGNSL
ncbi:MAG: hypothetical protein ACJ74U_04065 [Jatrophihabitantaceae bacterium]